MIEIFELRDKPDRFEELSHYVWSKWGASNNYCFYSDCMKHSLEHTDVPRFYFVFGDEMIIGSFAILRSELVARQDLTP